MWWNKTGIYLCCRISINVAAFNSHLTKTSYVGSITEILCAIASVTFKKKNDLGSFELDADM